MKNWVNQLNEISDTDRAYIAGLVDADGCLTMTSNGSDLIRPILLVIMTNKAIIEWLSEVWGTPINDFAKHRGLEHHKRQYRVAVTGKRAVEVVQSLLPYMRVKHRQAEIFVEWGDTNARLKDTREDVKKLRLKMKEEIHFLNADRRPHPGGKRG